MSQIIRSNAIPLSTLINDMKKSLITAVASLTVATQITTATDNLINATNSLGLDLYNHIQQKDSNTCYSPFSIQTAMLMAYNGAAGETEKEMHKVLRLESSKQSINAEAKKYHKDLITRTTKKLPDYLTQNKTRLFTANKIFIEKNYSLKESFTNTLQENYNSTTEKLSFQTQPDQSRNYINNYVSKSTKNKINNLLPEDSINADTKNVLVNSIYFKASWQKAFDPSKTAKRDFLSANGVTQKIDTMSQTSHFGYKAENNYELLTIPYSGNNNFQLLIILPKKDLDLGSTMKDINTTILTKAKALPTKRIQLFIPKFKIGAPAIDLKNTLKKLGMNLAFSSRKADFSNMYNSKYGLQIGAIFHKATIEVEETGTIAVAATAISMPRFKKSHSPPLTVKINRPFFFAIQDKATGNCLFMGDIKNL